MVLIHRFSEIFNEINYNTTVNLPSLKENGLKINYCKDDVSRTFLLKNSLITHFVNCFYQFLGK